MTIGSINHDAYTALPAGGWSGSRGYDNHNGVDRDSPYTIPELVESETRGMGLGAKATRDIYTAIEQHAKESNELMRENKRKAYVLLKETRLRDAERRRDDRIRSVVTRRENVAAVKAAMKAQNDERSRRKAAGLPYQKRTWLEDLGVPYVTIARHRYPKPDQPLPKRRRELDVPHNYSRVARMWGDTATQYQTYWWCPRLEGGLNDPVIHGDQWLKNTSVNWTVQDLLPVGIDTELVNKLREKINGGDFHLGIFLGEGHQSLKLIGDTAIKLAKMFHHVKRGDFWGASRAMFENTSRGPLSYRSAGGIPTLAELNRSTRDELGRGAWSPGQLWGHVSKDANTLSARVLELQYGWRPMVSDMYGAAQSLGWNLHAPFLFRERVRRKKTWGQAGSQHIYYWDYVDKGPYPGAGCQPQAVYYTRNSASCSHKRQLLAYLREEPHGLARLGLADPESVLWELVPWSFVIDWALPIGDYLQARGFARQLNGTFVTTDLKSSKAGTWSDFEMTRTVATSLDVQMPKVKPLTKVLSFQHCLNGLALLTQMGTGYTAKVR